MPVVSFFDPDGLIRRLQLGAVPTSIDDMREAIRGLLEVDVYRENIGRRARDFAAREFTSAAASRYFELLDNQTACAHGSARPTEELFHDHPRVCGSFARRARAVKTDDQAAAATRPDALFVLSNLGIGGSERKIVRLANRLKEEGVHVVLACLNGPFTTRDGHPPRRAAAASSNARASFPCGALWRLRQFLLRERPRTVLARESLPVAVRGAGDLAAAVSSAHRGAGEYLDLPRAPGAEALLPVRC